MQRGEVPHDLRWLQIADSARHLQPSNLEGGPDRLTSLKRLIKLDLPLHIITEQPVSSHHGLQSILGYEISGILAHWLGHADLLTLKPEHPIALERRPYLGVFDTTHFCKAVPRLLH